MVIMVVVVVVGVMWQSGERIPIYLRLLTENFDSVLHERDAHITSASGFINFHFESFDRHACDRRPCVLKIPLNIMLVLVPRAPIQTFPSNIRVTSQRHKRTYELPLSLAIHNTLHLHETIN